MSKGKWAIVILAVCLLVTVAALAYAAGKAKAAAPKVVRAQAFELVDAEGRVRARLHLAKPRWPELVMMDEGGMALVILDGDPEAPGLVLSRADGPFYPRVVVSASRNGEALALEVISKVLPR